MFLNLITIFICFNIALEARLHPKIFNSAEEHFVRLNGKAGSDGHASKSQDKENLYKQVFGVETRVMRSRVRWSRWWSSKFNRTGGRANSALCGKPEIKPNTFLRIIGGVEAIPNSWPWQVSVQSIFGRHFSFFCGGTIISATKVLTAANCLFSKATEKWKSIANLYVIAGIHNINDSHSDTKSQSMKVIKTAVPGQYDPKNDASEYDIAILYIAAPGFTFNDKVQPACLPSCIVPDKTSCYATGWGSLGANKPKVYGNLYQVEVPIVPHSTCSLWYGPKISTAMICAGYAEGGKDACQGDRGGPLACNHNGTWVLDGILSSDTGCGEPRKPGVYTRLYDYLGWINLN